MKNIFEKYNIEMSWEQLNLFDKFLDIFMEKNSNINLSWIRDREEIIEKHFIDSIILTKFMNLYWKIVDIWTGWWFPAIPLSIYLWDKTDLLAVDSIWKKIDAVNEFIDELWLENIAWLQARAEELWKDISHRWKYDFVVSRAVCYLPKLIKYSIAFLKKWGFFIAYKLENKEEMLDGENILNELWARIEFVKKYEIWWQERIFIFIKKLK